MKSTKRRLRIENRQETVLRLYKDGKTLGDIARLFRFTRSRAQQVVKAAVKNEIIKEFGLTCLTDEDKKLLEVAARQEMEEISQKRKEFKVTTHNKQAFERMQEKMSKLPHYSFFLTLSDYARAMDENVSLIKQHFPQVAKEIINKAKNKWSRLYNKCRSCGTTTIKHQSYGLCKNCYFKSDIFKELQESSRLRNQAKWRKKQLMYIKKYKSRPEVKERERKNNDIKFFGGNRENALIRDHYACVECGMTRDQSVSILKKDLFVKHAHDKNNNSLNNLVTLCGNCFSRRTVKIMRMAIGKNKQNNEK